MPFQDLKSQILFEFTGLGDRDRHDVNCVASLEFIGAISMNREERIKIELSTLLDEYKLLKAEIVSNLNSGRQVVNLTLTAIGFLVAAGKSIVDSGSLIIFLIAPLFFNVLAWTQLRYTFLVLDMGAYLRNKLVKHIREALKELSPESLQGFSYVMEWEEAGKGLTRGYAGFKGVLFLLIAGSNYGIPLFAAVASTLAFFLLVDSMHVIIVLEIVLIVANLLSLVYSSVWGWIAERRR